MKNVSRRGIFLVSIFLICIVAVLWRRFGASNTINPEQQSVRDSLYQQKRVLQYNTKVYSRAIRLANNGDIVVRLGTDLSNEKLWNAPIKDSFYNHTGIISREHDTVFVYHAADVESRNGQPLIREPLWTYGHPAENKRLALYRITMDSSAVTRLIALVQQLRQQHISFDTAFNKSVANNSLYATTFVTYSFETALQDTSLFHHPVAGGKPYISVDDIIGSSRVTKIESWEY